MTRIYPESIKPAVLEIGRGLAGFVARDVASRIVIDQIPRLILPIAVLVGAISLAFNQFRKAANPSRT